MAQRLEILSKRLDGLTIFGSQPRSFSHEALEKVRELVYCWGSMNVFCCMPRRCALLPSLFLYPLPLPWHFPISFPLLPPPRPSSSAHLPSSRGSSGEARGSKSSDIVPVSSSEARGSVPFLTSLHWHSPPSHSLHLLPDSVPLSTRPFPGLQTVFTAAAAVKPVVVLPFSPPSLPSTPPRAPCSLQLPLFPPSQVCTPAFFAEAAAVKPVAAATAATAAAALGSGTGGAGGAGEGGEVGAGRGGERGEWSELAREAMEDLDDEERLEEFVQNYLQPVDIPTLATPSPIFPSLSSPHCPFPLQLVYHYSKPSLVYRNSKPSGAKAVADTWLKPRRQLTVYAGQARKQAGVHMMTIPRALFLATDKMLQDGVPYQGPVWSTGMAAAWLCREMVKGRESFWWPYLQFLPPSVGLPFFFKPETLMELDSPAFVQKISTHLNNYRSEYNRIAPHLRANTTFFEYLWAVSIINSRAFGDQTRGAAAGLCLRALFMPALHALLPFYSQLSSPSPPLLLPLSSPSPPLLLPLSSPSPPLLLSSSTQIGASQIDFIALMPFARGDELFTSSPPPLLPVYSSSPPLSPPIQASQFEFIALMPFTKGAELFTSYGPKVNEELLLGYGFVLDGNKQENALLFRTLLDAVNLVALVLHRDAARPGEWVAGPGGLGGAAGKGGKTGEARDVSECHEGSEGEGEEEEEGKKRTCAVKYGDEAVEGGGAAVSAEAGSKGDRELKQGLARIWGEGLGDWLALWRVAAKAVEAIARERAEAEKQFVHVGAMPQYLARQEIRRESEADEVNGGVEVLAGKYKDPSFGVSQQAIRRESEADEVNRCWQGITFETSQKQQAIRRESEADEVNRCWQGSTFETSQKHQAIRRESEADEVNRCWQGSTFETSQKQQAIRRESEADEVNRCWQGSTFETSQKQQAIRRESEADEVNGGVEVLAGKHKDPSFGMSVWHGAVVEPNLMAVFAAVWYYLKHQSGKSASRGASPHTLMDSHSHSLPETPLDMTKSLLYGAGPWPTGGVVSGEPPADIAESVLLYLGWAVSNSAVGTRMLTDSPVTFPALPQYVLFPPSTRAPGRHGQVSAVSGVGKPPSDMAKSVLYLGWGVSNNGCKDVASPFSNVLPALQAAADTVRLLAQARLQQIPTSIEEDEAILRELERCKSGGKVGAGGGEGVKGGKLGKEGKKKPAQSKQQQKAKLTSLEEDQR
ncbi:unnamed protein product [Closterium sp. Naga37s-1]|nr:unnamed protein product [Closterium sp. Naga37s-1]